MTADDSLNTFNFIPLAKDWEMNHLWRWQKIVCHSGLSIDTPAAFRRGAVAWPSVATTEFQVGWCCLVQGIIDAPIMPRSLISPNPAENQSPGTSLLARWLKSFKIPSEMSEVCKNLEYD
eukprot:gene318-biopygen1072